MGVFRQLVKIMTGIIIAFNNGRTVGSKTYVPSNISDLGHNERSFRAHLADLVPHREDKTLDGGTCLGMMREKVLALINSVIRYLAGLLIHRGCHSAAVEVINRVPVIAEPYTSARNMDLTVLQYRNYPYRIDRMGVDRADRRVLNKDFFEQMGPLHVKEPLIQMLRVFFFAVDHLDSLAAGTEIRLGYEFVVFFYETDDLILVIFPDRNPLTGKKLPEMLVKFDLVVDQMSIFRIVIPVYEVIAPAAIIADTASKPAIPFFNLI